MKTSTNTNILLKSLDLKLKAILVKDLKKFKIVQANKQLLAA